MQESRAFRVYDLRLSNSARSTAHTHAVPTVVVAIAGAVEAEPATRLGAPGQWVLVESGRRHTLSSTGPAHVVEVEVR